MYHGGMMMDTILHQVGLVSYNFGADLDNVIYIFPLVGIIFYMNATLWFPNPFFMGTHL